MTNSEEGTGNAGKKKFIGTEHKRWQDKMSEFIS